MENMFCKDIKLLNYQAFPLILGAWDHFDFDEVLSDLPDKKSDTSLDQTSQLVKSLIIQLCDTDYQYMVYTSEFYSKCPVKLMFDNVASHENLNRNSLSDMLDVVNEYGPEELFVKAAKAVFKALELSPNSAHIEITSFYYDEKSKEDPTCLLRVSKDNCHDLSPNLNQVIQLHVVDDTFGIPMFAKTFSGNTSDNEAITDFCNHHIANLKSSYHSLTRIVGDSTLCTQKIFDEAKEQGMHVVTRIPDSFSLAK